MDMRDLIVPPQLFALLEKAKDFQPVHTPRRNVERANDDVIPDEEAADIPSDIDSYPFSRFVREKFRDQSQWGVLSQPLRHSIIKSLPDQDAKAAAMLNRMILRHMIDKNLKGAELKLMSDYITTMVLQNYHLRDEVLTQIASLTWNNYNEDHQTRLWLLMTHILSCTSPSQQLHKYLLKYVSDHGKGRKSAYLQQKLLRMPQAHSEEENRLFAPSVLEWQANNSCAPMAIKVHLSDDSVSLVAVNSWTTVEEAANRALVHKLGNNVQGWSLALEHDNGEIIEVSGHDYLFDLFTHMETIPEVETPPHEFMTYRSKTGSNPAFDPSEFLQTENPSQKPPPDPVQRTQSNKSNKPQKPDTSFSGNFSYGPPNIQMSNSGYDRHGRASLHDLHVNPSSGRVDTAGISKRIKGGGRMMQPMGMGGMMMQPQMAPMMQPQMAPMMQPQMPPMMQPQMAPMMQPQMGQMQPQMMPMQSAPMMQPQMQHQMGMQQMQPQMGMQQMQPQMGMQHMQPQMGMQQMQPQMSLAMPSSIGMMSSAMDPAGQQQSAIQKQMQQLMKQQEEQQKNLKKLLKEAKKSKDDSDSDSDNVSSHRRRSKRDDRRQRRRSSEDRKPSYRRRERYSSEEEEPKRRGSGRKAAGAAAAASYARRQDPPEKPKPHYGAYQFKEPRPRVSSTEPQPEKFQRSVTARKPEKEDIPVVSDEGDQGTDGMSFSEKRRFFLAKANAESQPSLRKTPPKKIDLPKADERRETPRRDSDRETGEQKTPERRITPSWKKPEEKKDDDDTHKEALRKITESKRKSQDNRTEALALLSRQRREAARKQSTGHEPRRSPSPEPAPKPKPILAVTKLAPQRMTPVREPPPKLETPPSTPPSPSPKTSPRESARVDTRALETALAAKYKSQSQQQQLLQTQPQVERKTPPLPPPIEEPEPVPETAPSLMTDANTRTVLHQLPKQAPYHYVNVRWKIRVRKEVFHSGEYIKDSEMAKLVFGQIVREAQNGNPRIFPADRDDIKQRVASSEKMELATLKSMVQISKENWPIYFTQIFRVKVREIAPEFPNDLYQTNAIGVGQTGVHFITTKDTTDWEARSYDFTKVSQAKEASGVLELLIQGKTVKVHCRKANHLKRVILPYLVNPPPKRSTMPVVPRIETLSEQEDMPLDHAEPEEDVYEVLPPPAGSQFSLLIFAGNNFRRPKEAEKALQHSKASLSKTLLEINDPEQANTALQCFKLIQQFMGDTPTKATSDEAVLYKILGLCRKFQSEIFLDEVTIYLAKQTTFNKKQSSCVRGWRLFSFFVAYYACSKRLMPHLLAHLHEINDRDNGMNSNGAAVCLVNLQQTITYHGRQFLPSDVEVKALMVGRTSFEQVFHIPGMAAAKFKINTTSVIKVAISHFCGQLGIKNEEEMAEYGIFAVFMDQNNQMVDIIPQKRNVYLLDILNQMKKNNTRGMLTFQRVVWKNQINYDNERLVQMLFQQVVPEYIDGKFLTFREITEGLTKAQLDEAAKISALCHRGISGSSLPTPEEVTTYMPRKAIEQQSEFVWKEQAQNHFTTIQNISQHQARSEVLALLSNKKMFGATFFTVEIAGQDGSRPKMLAIDAKHLTISNSENHYIDAEYALSSVVGVEHRIDEATQSPVCDISIQTESGVMPLSLKTRKAAVINGVLKHHIAILIK